MDGTWYSPAMGKAGEQLGLDGEGSLTWSDSGVVLTGLLQSKNATSVFGCLGFFVGFVFSIGLAMLMKTEAIAVLGLAGVPLGVRLGRVIFRPRPLTLAVPWSGLKTLRYDESEFDGQHPAVSFCVKGSFFSFAPKGFVFFVPSGASPQDVVEMLRPFAELKGVKVEKPRLFKRD